jgi:hypothetical protein
MVLFYLAALQIIIIKPFAILILLLLPVCTLAQQKNLYNLLHDALQEADRGFLTFVKDTTHQYNLIPLKDEVVDQYAGADREYLSFEKDYKSTLIIGQLYTLNEMQIIGNNVGAGDKTWEEVKDSMFNWYKKNVDFLISRYDALLAHTEIIIRPEDEYSKLYPPFITYFYHKAVQLPPGITDYVEIKRQLDVAPYFSVELRRPMLGKAYHLVFEVHGATAQ